MSAPDRLEPDELEQRDRELRVADARAHTSRTSAAGAAVVSQSRRIVRRLGVPVVILIALAVLFALQNLSRVTIAFWTVRITSPIWISLYFWLAVGVLAGYFAGRGTERRAKR